MAKIPSPFWAVLLAFLGVGLAIVALFHPSTDTVSQAVLTIASSLVSGALGAFAGHAVAASKSDVTTPEDKQ